MRRPSPWIAALLLLPAAGAAPLAHAQEEERAERDVLALLIKGEGLKAAGDHAALLGTAESLRLLGARPMEGQGDVARGWIEEARAHGMTRPVLTPRGRALGPGYRRGSLSRGESMTIRQIFLGGQPARVVLASVGGAGEAALSVAVRDVEGHLMCGGGAECVWQPAYSGRFDIEIVNEGSGLSEFYMAIK